MSSICLYFSIHQPIRLRLFRFFDVGKSEYYYDDYNNEMIIRRVTENCYLPANKIILDLIHKHQGRFKVAFSISGTAIDQFKLYAPEVIESFRELAATGCVEFLAETYSHSLAELKNEAEFKSQVESHSALMESLFGTRPTIFANTESIYSDEIGALVAQMGYIGILAEGPTHILNWKNPNYIYRNAIHPDLSVLLNDNQLSQDIALRFSDSSWTGWPLTSRKYASWLNKISKGRKVVNLFMDYETFGERQKFDSGIFEFLKSLPSAVMRKTDFEFMTPSEIIMNFQPLSTLNMTYPSSINDHAIELTSWLGNDLQQEAFENLYKLSDRVLQCSDPDILKDWQYLQTSDHFKFMSTEYFSWNHVHASNNLYDSPYDAFINYMNVLNDFTIRLNRLTIKNHSDQSITNIKSIISE